MRNIAETQLEGQPTFQEPFADIYIITVDGVTLDQFMQALGLEETDEGKVLIEAQGI